MCGAIDGTHCKLYCNHHNHLFHVIINMHKHDIYNVLLQGVCDSQKIFWDVCVIVLEWTYDVTHLRQYLLCNK